MILTHDKVQEPLNWPNPPTPNSVVINPFLSDTHCLCISPPTRLNHGRHHLLLEAQLPEPVWCTWLLSRPTILGKVLTHPQDMVRAQGLPVNPSGCCPRLGPALDPMSSHAGCRASFSNPPFPRLQPWAWLETPTVSQEGSPRSPAYLAAGALPQDSRRP